MAPKWLELSCGRRPPGRTLDVEDPPSAPSDHWVWRRVPVEVELEGVRRRVIARWVGVVGPTAGPHRLVARVGSLTFDLGDPAGPEGEGLAVEVDGARWRIVHPVYGPAGWTEPGHQWMPPAWALLGNRERLALAQAREAERDAWWAQAAERNAETAAAQAVRDALLEERWQRLYAAAPWLVELFAGGDPRRTIRRVLLLGGYAPKAWAARWRVGGAAEWVLTARRLVQWAVEDGIVINEFGPTSSPGWWAGRTVFGGRREHSLTVSVAPPPVT